MMVVEENNPRPGEGSQGVSVALQSQQGISSPILSLQSHVIFADIRSDIVSAKTNIVYKNIQNAASCGTKQAAEVVTKFKNVSQARPAKSTISLRHLSTPSPIFRATFHELALRDNPCSYR